jgi:integrase
MHIQTLKRKNSSTYKVIVKRNGIAKSKTFKRKHDALKWGQEMENMLQSQGRINITFEQLADEWLNNHSKEKNSYKTYLDNVAKFKFINTVIGKKIAQDITYGDIEVLASRVKEERERKPVTINRFIKLAKTVFNYGIRKGDLMRNPVQNQILHKEPEVPYQFWQLEEAERFIAYIDQKYQHQSRYIPLVYRLALNTGMRLGEIRALKWDSVFLGNRPSITVRRTYCDRTRQLIETTKGRKVRHVGINEALLPAIKEAHRSRTPDCDFVVFTDAGRPLDARNLRKRFFDKDIRESGVTKIRFHDLRHTFASLFVMNGGNLFDLQKILGHSDSQMTMRYAHHSKDYILDKAKIVVIGKTDKVISVDFRKKAL